MFLPELEEWLVGSGVCTVWRSIIVGYKLYWFGGYLLLWLSPSCTGCRPGRVAYWWFVITPALFFELDGWLECCSGLRRLIIFAKSLNWPIRNRWLNAFRSRDGIGYFLRLANSRFCWKGCMLSRFTVMMCASIAIVGGKLRFLSWRRTNLWHCIFDHFFLLSRRELL